MAYRLGMFLLLGLVACESTPARPDGGVDAHHDAGRIDTTAEDTRTTVDTSHPSDLGDTADTGTADTGTADTGLPDTGLPDTGTADTGTADTGTADTGTADTGLPDSSGTAQSFCAAYASNRVFCNDLADSALVTGNADILVYDPFSGGLQTTSWLSRGYSNALVRADGALRFSMHDGGENDTGAQFPMGSANLATQLNVGFVMRLGADFLQDQTSRAKFVVIQGTSNGVGWRPTLGVVSVVDTGGVFGTPGSRYWVFLAADDAAGLTSDEFGREYPADSYAAGHYHTFRLDNYVGQWIYVEYEAVLSGTHKLFVATPDGAFDGDTPLAQVPSRTTSASMPWYTAQVNAYWGGFQGTTATSTVDVDLLQIDGRHIGPPPGFFD